MFDNNLLRKLRIGFLFSGVLVSWTTTLAAFMNFYRLEGTLFKIKDCIIPNPVTTPCFWGALAFMGALIWSLYLLKNNNEKSDRYLFYFLIGCVIFAWGNFTVELMGITPKPGALIAPCPATGTNPFLSACFFGSVLFTLSLTTNFFIQRKGSGSSA